MEFNFQPLSTEFYTVLQQICRVLNIKLKNVTDFYVISIQQYLIFIDVIDLYQNFKTYLLLS